jgi:3',5'-cyclic AMP phosphodiesterase CpdA
MLTLLHISDLHFGPPYIQRVGDAALKAAQSLQPDVIVASGDFTQRATREQFAKAREFLDALPPAPCIVVPGNHDVPLYRFWERLRDPLGNYRHYITDQLDYDVQQDGIHIVALNSTAPYQAITNGRISSAQLDFCESAFSRSPPEALRVVVAHHHFAPAPDYEGGEVMPKAKRAMERFMHSGVEMILGGHLHRAYIGNSLDVYPAGERRQGIIIVQSGTTTSQRGRVREREKNSFNLIRVGEYSIHITHYMFFDETDGFAPLSRHEFPRTSKRPYLDGHPK